MTFWALLSAWSGVYHVLCPTHLRPPTLATTKRKRVCHEEKSVPSRPIRWRRCGGRWAGPLLCDWGNRFIRQTQSLLLPDVQEGRVCHETCSAWDPAPFQGNQSLSERSASSSGNSRLAGAWLWRQSHERKSSWAAAGADLEGFTSGER